MEMKFCFYCSCLQHKADMILDYNNRYACVDCIEALDNAIDFEGDEE